MPDLLFFMLFGHICGDFALQTDRMAKEKRTSKATLTLHVTVYTLTIAASLLAAYLLTDVVSIMQWMTIPVLLFIFVEHWIQDYVKVNGGGASKQAFYLDQAVHLLILFVLRLTIYHG
jgi:hypothetical protein